MLHFELTQLHDPLVLLVVCSVQWVYVGGVVHHLDVDLLYLSAIINHQALLPRAWYLPVIDQADALTLKRLIIFEPCPIAILFGVAIRFLLARLAPCHAQVRGKGSLIRQLGARV